MATTYAPDSLEAECLGGIPWAWDGLGECVQNTRDKISIAFGVLAIAAWFAFGFPQMVTNCVKKIPDEAVSPWLLFFWLLGDSLNFIGAFLADQLFLQKVLAGYTVAIDLILIGQYAYYWFLHRHKVKKYDEDYNHDDNNVRSSISKMSHSSTSTKTLTTVLLGVVGFSYYCMPAMLSGQGKPPHLDKMLGRRLLQTNEEKIGYAIGWVGAVMYFASRVPQIVQNFKRKSTEGLSLYLFLLAIFGNIFYGLQIFIKSVKPAYLVKGLPWILGSLGILVFDFIIVGQFFKYRHNTTDANLEDPGDEYGNENEKDYVI